jgi:hypothetical protein
MKPCSFYVGDCIDAMREMPDSSIDSLVTDPPAGIAFMGKDWDKDKGGRDAWVAWMTEVMREAMRVLKPGAHGLVWALPRTSHWTATALEDAGFEVRDVVTHLFGTGFPKSLDVSKAIDKAAGAAREVVGKSNAGAGNKGKLLGEEAGGGGCTWDSTFDLTAPATDAAKQWQGWGTALKPASEHWILVRKPCSEKTVAANVLKWGTGALNIDASRIEAVRKAATFSQPVMNGGQFNAQRDNRRTIEQPENLGRFPANLVLDEEAAKALDEQSGPLPQRGNKNPTKRGGGMFGHAPFEGTTGLIDDSGSKQASRFFYVAKASKSDKGADNTHPTVKSTALMEYLIKLVTPPGGVVLDPFAGSGSTGVAALRTGFRFVGIEQDQTYADIAVKRLTPAA